MLVEASTQVIAPPPSPHNLYLREPLSDVCHGGTTRAARHARKEGPPRQEGRRRRRWQEEEMHLERVRPLSEEEVKGTDCADLAVIVLV